MLCFVCGSLSWHGQKNEKIDGIDFSEFINKTLDDLNISSSLLIGFLQCVAMWPGTSRSMMTIVGGYLVGLSRIHTAEFSFILGLSH